MREKKKLKASKIFSAVFFLSFALLFALIPVDSDMGTVIFVRVILPAICLTATFFTLFVFTEKNLYSPEIDPSPLFVGLIQKAYDSHCRENSDRMPIDRELEPVGNIILNKKKYIEGMNLLIENTGLSRAEFEQDYYSGEIFRSITSMLNISRNYVTYSDTNGNQFIIRTKKIIGVYPLVENVDMSNCGVNCGTIQKFYMIIVTPDITYKFALADFMDRPVMDSFRRISPYLHYEHELYRYPFPISTVETK